MQVTNRCLWPPSQLSLYTLYSREGCNHFFFWFSCVDLLLARSLVGFGAFGLCVEICPRSPEALLKDLFPGTTKTKNDRAGPKDLKTWQMIYSVSFLGSDGFEPCQWSLVLFAHEHFWTEEAPSLDDDTLCTQLAKVHSHHGNVAERARSTA